MIANAIIQSEKRTVVFIIALTFHILVSYSKDKDKTLIPFQRRIRWS